MIAHTDGYATSFPKEDTDTRQDWINPEMVRRCANPDLIVLRGWHYYDLDTFRPWSTCVLMVRPGRTLAPDVLDLQYARYATEGIRALNAIPVVADDVAYQVSVPGPAEMAGFTWGLGVFRHYPVEVAAAVREVQRVLAVAGDRRVVFQLEIPLLTYLVARAPARLRDRVADRAARGLCEFVAQCPEGAEFIIHECDGRPRGKPLITRRDTGPLVVLTNAIIQRWPVGRVLDAVHLPLGDVTHPAPTGPGYYAALRDLTVPASVHVSAGIANLIADLDTQVTALQEADRSAGRLLGVSQPCGGGGQDTATAELMMGRLVDLAHVERGV
jgi:hypothetical protein